MVRDSFEDRFGRHHSGDVRRHFEREERLGGTRHAERSTRRELMDATFGRGKLTGRTGDPFKDDPFFNPWAKGGTFDRSGRDSGQDYPLLRSESDFDLDVPARRRTTRVTEGRTRDKTEPIPSSEPKASEDLDQTMREIDLEVEKGLRWAENESIRLKGHTSTRSR